VYAWQIRSFLEREKGSWDGLVLDLSAMPVDKALPLLAELAPPQDAAARR
jgi:hypothetical protein